MKIRYRHFSEPDVEKIHDTEKALKNNIGFFNIFGGPPTQEQYDKEELERFARDHQKGYILSYEVSEEGRYD